MSSAKEFPFKRIAAKESSKASDAHRLYDQRNLHISLRQWRLLHAVVDCDGFTGAGAHLHLSQSAISYSIAKLQEQLGLPLLKIEGRKARLTEDGRMLLDRSRGLMREALELEMLAENLRKGRGLRVNLEVDVNFPSEMLITALREFNRTPFEAGVSLKESDCTRAEEALCERGADLAIAAEVPHGFVGAGLMALDHVAVAHPEHPLFKVKRPIATEDLDGHTEVIISSTPMPGRNSGRLQDSRLPPWYVSSFDTAVSVIRERFAYGWLPHHRIEHLLAQNQLHLLPMHTSRRTSGLYLIYGRKVNHNPAAVRLAQVLQAVAHADRGSGDRGSGERGASEISDWPQSFRRACVGDAA